MTRQIVKVGDQEFFISNLDKILWPNLSITKGQLLEYYATISPFALKHWMKRPTTVIRYPHGINQTGFFQKNCPNFAPEWISKATVNSIEYVLCNDLPSIIWLINQAAIELHFPLYQVGQPENPDLIVIDLDPTPPCGFQDVVEVAFYIKEILFEMGLQGFPKTSGATGLHIFLPIEPKYTFQQTSGFVGFIGKLLQQVFPDKVTTERLIKNRRGIYVDHLQNSASRTMAGVYSLRALPNATVSTPVTWEELPMIDPTDLNIFSVPQRLVKVGDLFADVITKQQSLDLVFERIPV